MNLKHVLLASAVLMTASTFAQKDEIKAAEKALKNGNAAEAKTLLQTAEPLLTSASDSEKSLYSFVKGRICLDLANKNIDELQNQIAASKAYSELIALEKATGKSKYTEEATKAVAEIKNKMINAAVAKANDKDYKSAANILYNMYELDNTETEKLYYAANYAINAKEYENALSYYAVLKSKNYTGESTSYYAKSIINEQEDFFGSNDQAKSDRDSKVKMKLYTNPRDEKTPSRLGEMYKNIALILVNQGKTTEAKAAIAEACKANPDDAALAMTEANLYLETKDFETYKKMVTKILDKNPNDAVLVYNLGVISSKNDPQGAIGYYKKALQLDPNYLDANINLAITILDTDKDLREKRNKLGTSAEDNKKYDIIKKQMDDIYRSAIPYLEKAVQLAPDNVDAAKTLQNVYSALDMTEKAAAIKAKLKK